MRCGVTTVIVAEVGHMRVTCTLTDDHDGDHYDTAFSQGWPRENE